VASLQLTGVKKRYESVLALADVSFDLADGQFMALLGPSGAGKTTTLKSIAGVETPDGGEIRIGGRLVNDIPAEGRNTALVFENYALYPNMTVYGNMVFPLKAPARAEKFRAESATQRVFEVARTLGIASLLERRTWELSGGQRQRVALGRALVREPDVFLMDEPISHLDAKLRFEMRAELKRLQRDIGVTTLYATPDYAEAMALADVIVVLREGRVIQVGTPTAVFNRPIDTYVAHLLGEPHINLLEMEIQSRSGRLAAVGQGVEFAIHPSQAELLRQRVTKLITVGVRPSEVLVSPTEPDGGGDSGTVIAVEPRGATTVLVVRAGGQQVVAKVGGEQRLRPDSIVWIGVKPESLYFFERESGARVEVPHGEIDAAGASR